MVFPTTSIILKCIFIKVWWYLYFCPINHLQRILTPPHTVVVSQPLNTPLRALQQIRVAIAAAQVAKAFTWLVVALLAVAPANMQDQRERWGEGRMWRVESWWRICQLCHGQLEEERILAVMGKRTFFVFYLYTWPFYAVKCAWCLILDIMTLHILVHCMLASSAPFLLSQHLLKQHELKQY